MNVPLEVIKDLLPAYFSGEASPATRSLVEEYFRRDPAFENEARFRARTLEMLADVQTPSLDSVAEKTALKSAKRLLRRQKILLALALTFTLNAISAGFSFEIADTGVRVHWLTLPGQREVILAILAIAAVLWVFYFRISRRVRKNILG